MNIQFLLLTSAVFILSGCASNPLAQKGETLKKEHFGDSLKELSTVSEFKSLPGIRATLKNGLVAVIIEDPSSPTFSYQTWFRVGSRHEKIKYTGLAHLFEHMMFKGTKNYPDGQFDKLLESAGAEGLNAFTSQDYTAYIQELPKEKLDLIMTLESDRMTNLIVNDQSFNTEREVVQNERRYRTENSPDGTLYQELYSLAYTTHPYHWPVIGYEEDLARMSAQDARDFYVQHYSPDNAIIVISGDINAKDVLKKIIKHYSGIPIPKRDNAVPLASEPEQTKIRRKTLNLNIQVEKLMMAFQAPSTREKDSAVLDVIQVLLSGGKSSRLNKALIDTGIATSADAFDSDDHDSSLFVFISNMQTKKSASMAENIILRELKRLSSVPVSEKELERAKHRLSFYFYSGLNSNSSRTKALGRSEVVLGHYSEMFKYYELTQQVTADDILRVAQHTFKPHGRTVVVGKPKIKK